jgi:pimeloyl-ACP methyl ester carboxylesterase
MAEIPVLITRNDKVIAVDLEIVRNKAVILISGWGGTRYGPQRILWRTAGALAKSGFSTLRIDFQGRGDSPGNPLNTTLDTMIDDVILAVEWLKVEYNISDISLVGICSGANVALGVASLKKEVTKVVCWSILPFMEDKTKAAKQGTPRKQMLMGYLKKIFRIETWKKLLRGEANVGGAMKTLAKDKEGDDLEKERKKSRRIITKELAGYTGEILFIFGENDPEAAGSGAFFTDWAKKNKIAHQIMQIKGAPHNFYTAAWTADVVEKTSLWIANENDKGIK